MGAADRPHLVARQALVHTVSAATTVSVAIIGPGRLAEIMTGTVHRQRGAADGHDVGRDRRVYGPASVAEEATKVTPAWPAGVFFFFLCCRVGRPGARRSIGGPELAVEAGGNGSRQLAVLRGIGFVAGQGTIGRQAGIISPAIRRTRCELRGKRAK